MTIRPTVCYCSQCGKLIVGWRRRPCRRCGATARTFVRTLTDRMHYEDEAH